MTRKLLRVLVAVVVLAAAGLTAWRVLRPSEVSSPARAQPYPVAAALTAGVTGKLAMAPLIVDSRIRVYAGTRMLKADGPVDARTMYTALWSYRRWPERLSGVVAADGVVVSRWTNGQLVALDAGTGRVLWQRAGGSAAAFEGRTGAGAVWSPPGLFVSGATVIVAGLALNAADGSVRWSAGSCEAGFVTAGGSFVCGPNAREIATGAPVASWPAGPSTPLGCDVARSGCAGLRDAAGQGWLTTTGTPVRTPSLDDPAATAAGDLVLTTAGGAISATGAATWRRPGDATILGARAGKVVLLTADLRLVTLDAATGAQLAAFPLYTRNERVEPWKPSGWQLTDNWVAVERLSVGESPDDPYYTAEPAVVAAL